MPPHKGGKKNRKFNRKRKDCARYAAEHRRTRNGPERTPRNPERSPGSGRKPVAATVVLKVQAALEGSKKKKKAA